MLKAVLFDLDDTLITFDTVSHPAWEKTAMAFPSINNSELLKAIHLVSHEYWSDPGRHREGRLQLDTARRMLVRKALESLDIIDIQLANSIADYYTELRESMITIYPHSLTVLNWVKNKSLKTALITNGESHKQREKIKRFDLESYFDTILVEQEFGKGKPEPEVYIHTLKKLNVKASEACMVGDNLEWDVFAPMRLDIYGIWNNYNHKSNETQGTNMKPDGIIHDIGELPDFLVTHKLVEN